MINDEYADRRPERPVEIPLWGKVVSGGLFALSVALVVIFAIWLNVLMLDSIFTRLTC